MYYHFQPKLIKMPHFIVKAQKDENTNQVLQFSQIEKVALRVVDSNHATPTPTPVSSDKTQRKQKKRVLVFSVGLNGYDKVYDQCMASHKAYADYRGYDHVLVNRPRWATVLESVWLKVPLILYGLEAGYDWVFFVDADCEIKPEAPPVDSVETEGKSLYFGRGFSGNFNSGVLIAKNTSASRSFFKQVWQACQLEVPEMDWGENGHIIHFSKGNEHVQALDRRWNNNADVELDDYVRHYSAGGPMRPLYRFSLQGQIAKWIAKIRNKALKLMGGLHTVPREQLMAHLEDLSARCQEYYPEFRFNDLQEPDK